MSSLAEHYLATGTALLHQMCAQNAPVLKQLGAVIGASVASGGVLHLFGSGHSEVIAREIIGRAGGLVCVSGVPDPTGGFIENLVGYGTALAGRYDRQHQLLPGETIIVISNSGKNSSPIEVALYAKQKGHNVVGLTSVAMAKSAATVHPVAKSCTRSPTTSSTTAGCPATRSRRWPRGSGRAPPQPSSAPRCSICCHSRSSTG